MSKNLRSAGLVSAFALLVLGLIPNPSLAAPDWDVVVVDERDQPVEGILVRETWQNFAVEKQGHVSERTTDATGRATFPAQRTRYSVLRQLVGTLRAATSFNMHGGYDAHSHAHVFALGKGLFGAANTDWKGSPPHLSSRIVVRSAILPGRSR